MAGFAGRAGSSAAALALCFLNKAFPQISGSHPQHSVGNYKCVQLASIGNVPSAKPFPICSPLHTGAMPVLCQEYRARHSDGRGRLKPRVLFWGLGWGCAVLTTR